MCAFRGGNSDDESAAPKCPIRDFFGKFLMYKIFAQVLA